MQHLDIQSRFAEHLGNLVRPPNPPKPWVCSLSASWHIASEKYVPTAWGVLPVAHHLVVRR
eukprot:5541784-Pyramimonas_sp.AAC.1